MAEGESFDILVPEKGRGRWSSMGRRKQWLIIAAGLIFLALAGYLFFRQMLGVSAPDNSVALPETAVESPAKTAAPATSTPPVVEPAPFFGDANYQSENFRVGDIAIGGEAEFLLTEDTPEPIEISAVRGETFVEKNKQQVKLVLSWKTNKLARSDVDYSKGVGQTKKTVGEDDYGLNHSLIIPGLEPASTYVYTILSEDRFGNTAKSDVYAVYTGTKEVSLFDLIADAVGDVFGWAVASP